jgi:serine protease inhibitor
MFVEKSLGVKEDFQKQAEKYFFSPAETVDFRSSADKARDHINTWVEENTNKKITNLLQPGKSIEFLINVLLYYNNHDCNSFVYNPIALGCPSPMNSPFSVSARIYFPMLNT